jgi:hypothetical protein
MGKEQNLEFALAKEACPVCGALVDGPILMNTKLTKKEAEKTKNLHGRVIGYLKDPCDSCQDLMSKGFLLIGVIEEKTDDEKNPWRSGHQWVINPNAAKDLFPDTSKGVAFIDIKAAKQIGLPVKDLDNKQSNENTNLQ